ncbi:hypothetical protein [Acinetobacter baumannii]|uniref:hypothetical protein n=1 Tax=Acinetobacter baumannii TaxID=470 RepID=UPI0022B1D48B|nr:hypothetical protein [Acinetobacter baumannii]
MKFVVYRGLLLFLGQKFDELFFDYTLDSYKPPALNPSFICREALSLINDIESEVIDRNNLTFVLEELDFSLRNDIIVKNLLTSEIEKFVLIDENVRLSDLKLRLEVLEKVLNPLNYFTLCCELLLNEISDNKGSKKTINQLATLLASLLINMGISKQHIYEKTKEFFFSEREIKDVEEVQDFFQSISPTHHHFEIFFLVSKDILTIKNSVDQFDIEIIDDLPHKFSQLAELKKLKKGKSEVWVRIDDIETFDRHSARRLAENTLEIMSDLFSLYSHKKKIIWRSKAIITQCCENIDKVISKAKSPMDKCIDVRPHTASKKLNYFLENISLKKDSFKKLNRVIDLHSTALASDLAENQLINIWIAIETIVPSSINGGGKVKKICNALEPILLKEYISRLLQNLIRDLLKWGRSNLTDILKEIDNYKDKKINQLVLELMALDKYKPLRNTLYQNLGNFHLLRYRCFELSEILKNPKNVLAKISLHEKKVSWQLRRIYRTRNLIVHSGRSLPYIDTLIENSHDYLDQTINAVVKYSGGYLNADTLEQVFEMAKLDYESFSKELKLISSFDENNILILLN